jgi:predicted ABC-type ATPase
LPQLWILAGANGAGKSTFFQVALEPRGAKLINADVIAKIIRPEHPESVSYQAAGIADKIRTALRQQGTSFCFETVFSHPSKIDFIARAKGMGYEVILIYLHLTTSQLNEARVRQRVLQGGHDVPAEKIHSRIPRTMQYVATALPLADEARLLDNSFGDDPFRQVAVIRKGRAVWRVDPLPVWARQMLSAIDSAAS